MTFRCVTQRCMKAKLLIDNDNEYVEIGKGLIVYVSWAKGATKDDIPKHVTTLLKLRLLGTDSSRNQNICEACIENNSPVHVLVIPQAALTSKVQRGKNLQYHTQLGKEDGAEAIYLHFVQLLKDVSKEMILSLSKHDATDEVQLPIIKAGTFGNRQALEFSSEGPFTHMFEM
ncbi:D-tyrosyl-tRNATyr deacylase 2 [Thraustotheca clavata]|uniref:D-tyrosyl-tRNATyr deacylase 2 n=1 Tax=Thraustotheca clavata TaxID=74557 RepID=A0A1V9Y6R6_9STRA|nr:D-tyrosyl-tRNATyr deacylase 2 [Thraustotheca clavata]